MNEAKQYVKRKRWKTIPKVSKSKFNFDTEGSKLNIIAIDPNTHEIVRVFKGVYEMEFATNRKNLQPLLHRYTRGILGKTGSPLLCGWIIVQLDDSEFNNKDMDEFQRIVRAKAMNSIVMLQLQRIRENLNAFTTGEKEAIFKFLANAEDPHFNINSIKIKL